MENKIPTRTTDVARFIDILKGEMEKRAIGTANMPIEKWPVVKIVKRVTNGVESIGVQLENGDELIDRDQCGEDLPRIELCVLSSRVDFRPYLTPTLHKGVFQLCVSSYMAKMLNKTTEGSAGWELLSF